MNPESAIRNGYHCAPQVHYHIVYPVKPWKVLLDAEVVKIIRETVAGIEERYEIQMEWIGMHKNHIHLLCEAHPKLSPEELSESSKA